MHTIDYKLLNPTTKRLEYYVFAFILLHVVVWTLIPTLIRFTLPMDAMEGTTWGHQLEWGYDKNPFLNGWLTAFAVFLSGPSGWGTYLLCQISVGLAFWTVWELGKKMLPPMYAFIAVLLLESIQYFNLHAIDFDDNVLELSVWSLTILFFYRALLSEKTKYWLLTAIFAGLSMMTKYYSALLLLSMLFFMLYYPKARNQFKQPPVYYALLVFSIIVTPHTIWLFSHDFVTINYALHRVNSTPHWSNHLFYPLQFAWQQIEVFLPAVFLLIILVAGKSEKQNHVVEKPVYNFDKTFLFFVGIGPFIITLILSLFTGIKLRAGWGQPLLTFWGLSLFAYFMPKITKARLERFVAMVLVFFAGTAIIYSIELIRANEPSTANFPGKKIAAQLEDTWHKTYKTPLPFVVGARWLAGNIAFYAEDQPSVYIDANKKFSPWINEDEIKRKGAIFVWDPTEAQQMSLASILSRFEKLGKLQIMHFPWLRNPKMAPVEITVAFLSPEHIY